MGKRKVVKQNRPNAVLYFLAAVFFSIYNKLTHHIVVKGDKPKGPALILSNHTSNEDYKLLVSACYPRRVNFLCTYHWFTFKKLAFWLKHIGAIPKHQFTTDLESMRKIQYLVQEKKGIVFIAPEGTVYANGKLGYISPAIAKMVHFLKVPVYTCKIQGAGLGNAKWTNHRHKDYVTTETKLIITKEESTALDINEILDRIITNLTYNEFDYQKENNIHIEGTDLAEGIETMFYKCPCCGEEFKMKSSGNEIECTCCHTKAHINDSFRFEWEGNKQYFDNYVEWYDWQYESVKQLVEKEDFIMEDDVDYGIDQPGVDNYIKVGKGKLTFTHKGWDYKGTFKGEEIEDHDDVPSVFLATLKKGVHFELPRKNGHNRVFYPTDGNTSMKWHLASRAMSEYLAEK